MTRAPIRFAIASDLHIALPHTIWDNPSRFHLVEVSIPALEAVLEHFSRLDLDFLLIPGDLTQDGEAENHRWLADRLAQLPYPVYVVPGNHDIPAQYSTPSTIGLTDFPPYYEKFGYLDPTQPYYTCELVPGVRLIGLNSNSFDDQGKPLAMGRLDPAQWVWLQDVLTQMTDEFVMVMIHHNVIEHLPGQTHHRLGQRYMLENAPDLLHLLRRAGVQLIFTGHLHVQDIAAWNTLYEITTGSLVSYPHPYRLLTLHQDDPQNRWLQIESHRVTSVPGWENLQHVSREWMGDRSRPFMLKLLTHPPLNLPVSEVEQFVADLRYFWADIADGDGLFDFPNAPSTARRYFQQFSAVDPAGHFAFMDNHISLRLSVPDKFSL